MRDFTISMIIGTTIAIGGQLLGFSTTELIILCVAGGMLQGIITAIVRGPK